MKRFQKYLFPVFICFALFLVACGKDEYTGPESVSPDQVNTVMNEAFADSNETVKKMVQDMLIHYSKKEFTESMTIVQAISARQDITQNQRNIAARCQMTVSDELNRMIREKGDSRAEQYMRFRNATK